MTPLWTAAGQGTLEGERLLVWGGHQSPGGGMGGGMDNGLGLPYHLLVHAFIILIIGYIL